MSARRQAGAGDVGGDPLRAGGVGQRLRIAALDVRDEGAGVPPDAEEEPAHQQQHHSEQYGDGGRLPRQDDRRPGDAAALAERARSVQPVAHALCDAAGQHPAEGAGQHGDGGGAEAVQRRTQPGPAAAELLGRERKAE